MEEDTTKKIIIPIIVILLLVGCSDKNTKVPEETTVELPDVTELDMLTLSKDNLYVNVTPEGDTVFGASSTEDKAIIYLSSTDTSNMEVSIVMSDGLLEKLGDVKKVDNWFITDYNNTVYATTEINDNYLILVKTDSIYKEDLEKILPSIDVNK